MHSLFVISGRVDASGSAANCTAVQEDFATQFRRGNVSLRIPTPTYGLGLVENIPDTALTANLAANAQQKAALGIAGHLNTNGNDGRVARFGWKAQNVSLLLFAGEAYNVEMGITNELFQTERDLNTSCQTDTTPNDITGRKTSRRPTWLFERHRAVRHLYALPGSSGRVDHCTGWCCVDSTGRRDVQLSWMLDVPYAVAEDELTRPLLLWPTRR